MSTEELARKLDEGKWSTLDLYTAATRLRELRDENAMLQAARLSYAFLFPPGKDGTPDVGSIHENIRKLKAENDALRAELAKHQESSFNPDWSKLEATRESLREHMAMIKDLRAEVERLREGLRYAKEDCEICEWADVGVTYKMTDTDPYVAVCKALEPPKGESE